MALPVAEQLPGTADMLPTRQPPENPDVMGSLQVKVASPADMPPIYGV